MKNMWTLTLLSTRTHNTISIISNSVRLYPICLCIVYIYNHCLWSKAQKGLNGVQKSLRKKNVKFGHG